MKSVRKAVILSAGQGKRLLPLTQDTPKCLLPLENGMSLLGWQLTELAKAGIDDVAVVSGFQAGKIRDEIKKYQSLLTVTEIFNPFYKMADNLGSVWAARPFMTEDFILLNGDTLFTSPVAQRLGEATDFPVTLTVSRKSHYDDDDMKVSTEGRELKAVGKKLPDNIVNGESIGMMKFSGSGLSWFKESVKAAMETEEGLKTWYLAVLDKMARQGGVGTIEAEQDEWCEVDFPIDYKNACAIVESWTGQQSYREGADTAVVS